MLDRELKPHEAMVFASTVEGVGLYLCMDCPFESPLMPLREARMFAAFHENGPYAQSFLVKRVAEVEEQL